MLGVYGLAIALDAEMKRRAFQAYRAVIGIGRGHQVSFGQLWDASDKGLEDEIAYLRVQRPV